MLTRDIIAIGASAGGIEALSRILPGLSPGLPASIFVVMHIAAHSPGYLATMFSERGPLPAKTARDGEAFKKGTIYVARPDRHLVLEPDGRIATPRGPKENHSRPAIDPLFRSAALAFGPRLIGIVLSGGLDDGTAGLRSIKMCGGTTVVQDPDDAVVASMPLTALRNVSIDYCKPADELAELIAELVASPMESVIVSERTMKKNLQLEVNIAKGLPHGQEITAWGEPSIFTCPECHGALLALRGESPRRYQCRTGHAFSSDSLLAELTEKTEETIWSALRSLQESAILMNHLAEHWQERDLEMANEYRRTCQKLSPRAAAAKPKQD